MKPTRLGNLLFLAACLPAQRRYLRARSQPRQAQLARLRGYLERHAETDFGRRHHYRRLESLEHFRDAVPVRDYEAFEPWIEQIRHGRQGVLTAEPVLMMEKTSGSSGPAKYIPYTRALRGEFQAAVGAWFADLYRHRPALLGGSQYWSVSPVARRPERTPGGLPVGFEDDVDYLGPLERRVMRWIQAVPPEVRRVQDIEQHRRITLEHLVARRDLRLVSVWNPSFLTLLLERLPKGLEPRELWPDLALVSCWTSVAAARLVGELEARLPGVEIQGKGLLSTEGVVSFPEIGRPAPSPAVTSHFLEFLDPGGRPHLVDELETGRRYEVLLTTGGGLARYATRDVVEVVAPGAIELVGRSDQLSDLVGEKLSQSFVAGVLGRIETPGFLMLAPEWGRPPRYLLFLDAGADADAGRELGRRLARDVEQQLRASVHYDYGRRLGQLAAVEAVPVPDIEARYLDVKSAGGARLGDVKPPSLERATDWRRRLLGEDAERPPVGAAGARETLAGAPS